MKRREMLRKNCLKVQIKKLYYQDHEVVPPSSVRGMTSEALMIHDQPKMGLLKAWAVTSLTANDLPACLLFPKWGDPGRLP